MIEIDRMLDCGVGDAHELNVMASEAKDFLLWHTWCERVERGYLHCGWAGILAVFYFVITPLGDADTAVWIVVGDVPPAYLDTVTCQTGEAALSGYIGAMQEWLEHVKAGKSVEDVIPVYSRIALTRVMPTLDFTGMLETRLKFIKDKLLPIYQEMKCLN